MHMTLVSVIIPTRNRSKLLIEAIESVLAVQRQGFDLEVLVVDDGSTDDTAAVVAQYPVTLLQGPGRGASAARNAGIVAAHGDFVAFLDDDDVWLPNNVTPQLAVFAANPGYAAVHAQVIIAAPDGTPLGDPTPAGPLSSGWIFDDLLGYWPQIASLVVRRWVFAEVGLFDVGLRPEGSDEEWDVMLRIARRYPFGRVAQPVALFRHRYDNNETLGFRRMPDTLAVFRRHTRTEPPLRRLRLQRVYWRHRGWYASEFLHCVQAHAANGNQKRAWRSVRYAFIASPPHALLAGRLFWLTLARVAARQVRAARLFRARSEAMEKT